MSRTHLRWLLAVSLVGGIARPAFADGVLGGVSWKVVRFVELLALVAVIAVIMLVIATLLSSLGNRIRYRGAKAALPTIPAARVVQDRDRSS